MAKLKKAELKEVQDLTSAGQELISSIGTLDYQKHMLYTNLDENTKKLETLKNKLQDKYGDVNINVSDGTYTKIEKDVENKKD
tara:strand:+ start:371 stop:619 length:249 start_codon:yes stop_codon:yes gene_type:complete